MSRSGAGHGGHRRGELRNGAVERGDQPASDPADLGAHGVRLYEPASEGKSFRPRLLVGELKRGEALALDQVERVAPVGSPATIGGRR